MSHYFRLCSGKISHNLQTKCVCRLFFIKITLEIVDIPTVKDTVNRKHDVFECIVGDGKA